MCDLPAQESALPAANVLGVPVACVDVPQLLQHVQSWRSPQARPSQKRSILYVNAHCLNIAVRDSEYHRTLNAADLVYSDGISVVWAARFLGSTCGLHKITGADWIEPFCQFAAQNGWRLYFLAGQPGIAHQAAANLQARHPGLQVAGTCDGFFQEQAEAQVLDEIARLQPDVVLVGMGTPHQEKWMAAHRQELHAPVVWAVGALFDYVAGREPRCPAWMNALALEWLWRLLVDPRRKWKRYMVGNPLFVARVVQQKLMGSRARAGGEG